MAISSVACESALRKTSNLIGSIGVVMERNDTGEVGFRFGTMVVRDGRKSMFQASAPRYYIAGNAHLLEHNFSEAREVYKALYYYEIATEAAAGLSATNELVLHRQGAIHIAQRFDAHSKNWKRCAGCCTNFHS